MTNLFNQARNTEKSIVAVKRVILLAEIMVLAFGAKGIEGTKSSEIIKSASTVKANMKNIAYKVKKRRITSNKLQIISR